MLSLDPRKLLSRFITVFAPVPLSLVCDETEVVLLETFRLVLLLLSFPPNRFLPKRKKTATAITSRRILLPPPEVTELLLLCELPDAEEVLCVGRCAD